MDVLKKGSTGEKVEELQKLLNQKGFQLLEDGIFGNDTYKAVKAFQSQNLDRHGRPLAVDGKVGALTWWSLNNLKPIVTHPASAWCTIFPGALFIQLKEIEVPKSKALIM